MSEMTLDQVQQACHMTPEQVDEMVKELVEKGACYGGSYDICTPLEFCQGYVDFTLQPNPIPLGNAGQQNVAFEPPPPPLLPQVMVIREDAVEGRIPQEVFVMSTILEQVQDIAAPPPPPPSSIVVSPPLADPKPRRGRGRPRKNPPPEPKPRRGRGRPKSTQINPPWLPTEYFTVVKRTRTKGLSAGNTDTYYIGPSGQRCRSRNDVMRCLKSLNIAFTPKDQV